MRYILIDMYNLFFRMRHTASRHATINDRLGMCMHTMLSSANKVVTMMDVDHVIFALDGHSWRKDFYKPYKKPRADARQARTEEEVEEDELYFETLNDLTKYLEEQTNCSVIRSANAEADDVIARWIKLHPNDNHVILSSDSDFHQLISNQVVQYNGVANELITLDGYFDDRNKPILDKKTKEHKQLKDPEWLLFEKCMRGDKSDNVFSAYPGVRTKGTKNKTGLLEAFDDRTKKGFAWNNLMLQHWTDHNGDEHRVLDDYERNCKLIDLSLQPQEIIDEVDLEIINTILRNSVTFIPANKINFSFMKFCGKHDLVKLAQYPENVIKWISKPYKGVLFNAQYQSKTSI